MSGAFSRLQVLSQIRSRGGFPPTFPEKEGSANSDCTGFSPTGLRSSDLSPPPAAPEGPGDVFLNSVLVPLSVGQGLLAAASGQAGAWVTFP